MRDIYFRVLIRSLSLNTPPWALMRRSAASPTVLQSTTDLTADRDTRESNTTFSSAEELLIRHSLLGKLIFILVILLLMMKFI